MIAEAVEGLVPKLSELTEACHLFFLDATPKPFLRVNIADERPPHLWLGEYLKGYQEELKKTEYLVFTRRGRWPGSQDIYLVSARSSSVFTLHVEPTGEMSWQKAHQNSLTYILGGALI